MKKGVLVLLLCATVCTASFTVKTPDGSEYTAEIMPRGALTSITIRDWGIQWNYESGAYTHIDFGLIIFGWLGLTLMAWLLDIGVITLLGMVCLSYCAFVWFQ